MVRTAEDTSSWKYPLQLFPVLPFPESRGIFWCIRVTELIQTLHADSTYTFVCSNAPDLTCIAR